MNGEDEAYNRGKAEGYNEGFDVGKEEGRQEILKEIQLMVANLLGNRKMS